MPLSMAMRSSKTRLASQETPKSMNMQPLQALVKSQTMRLSTTKLPYMETLLSQVMPKLKMTLTFMTTFASVNTLAFIVTRRFVTKSMFLVLPTSQQFSMAMKPSQVTPLSIPKTTFFASNQTPTTAILPTPSLTICGITTCFMATLVNSYVQLKPTNKDGSINNCLNS